MLLTSRAGFLSSAVAARDEVEPGQILGRIVDLSRDEGARSHAPEHANLTNVVTRVIANPGGMRFAKKISHVRN